MTCGKETGRILVEQDFLQQAPRSMIAHIGGHKELRGLMTINSASLTRKRPLDRVNIGPRPGREDLQLPIHMYQRQSLNRSGSRELLICLLPRQPCPVVSTTPLLHHRYSVEASSLLQRAIYLPARQLHPSN